jgi:aminoglycoside/choline kinase family phosphotransferase
MLGEFQQTTQFKPPPAFVTNRVFDAAIVKWELEHYVEWRIEAALGKSLTRRQSTQLGSAFDRLVAQLSTIPLVPMHRDFQSHNIMVRADRSLVMLDFQDAMLGPAVYDVVALLRDSYIEIPRGVLTTLVRRYGEGVAGSPALAGASVGDVERWFHMQTLQRKLKDAGRFVFIDRVKGNPDFLQYVDVSCRYIRDAFLSLGGEFDDLASLLSDIDPDVTP